MNRRKFISIISSVLLAVGIIKPENALAKPIENPWAKFSELDPILERAGIHIGSRAIEQSFQWGGWLNAAKTKMKTEAVYTYTWHVSAGDKEYMPVREMHLHCNGEKPWSVRDLSTDPQPKYGMSMEEAIDEILKRYEKDPERHWWNAPPPSSG